MAVAPNQARRDSPISRLLSRFKPNRKTRETKEQPQDYFDPRAPLKPSPLPLVLPEHQHILSQLGWTIVTFPQPTAKPSSITKSAAEPQATLNPGSHPIQTAYEDLFRASAAFFDLPDEEKEKWKTRHGSEEGWSKIPGEKEFITLRTLAYTPDVLKGPAKRYWDLMGSHLDACLGRISSTLDIPDGENEGLRRFVGPCKEMGDHEEQKTATMLRLFRYEGWQEKIVAEPHADLGLLSCVVGDVPGLEVWNGAQHIPIEKDYSTPCATLLGGRQLERLSNFRYPAGGHRVVAYGKSVGKGAAASQVSRKEPAKYRFSIVFVLRAHEDVMVDTDLLKTEITGPWREPIKDVTAGKLYAELRGAHFNINTGMKERNEQRKRIEERKRLGVKTGEGAN
ncbi:hypothetical protein BU24DRAFT_429410 [Aaosphaeria arxii CBS 175.79]|uniref:Clavaminate synthase-like protein n=1 Tax=Aaosphaeria arxii CBS 175.79 TaxID=1450172 RepID=A0A6A5X690_9PLEO|nr:uncharacterized protein BU24DRAFT_429410 [Aaosphaeria arxii CBS 175.79]KAF2008391.1 hypothetical protein BU24DRAFT_429410 [Aaosphaeria arxii CBS 175.79]